MAFYSDPFFDEDETLLIDEPPKSAEKGFIPEFITKGRECNLFGGNDRQKVKNCILSKSEDPEDIYDYIIFNLRGMESKYKGEGGFTLARKKDEAEIEFIEFSYKYNATTFLYLFSKDKKNWITWQKLEEEYLPNKTVNNEIELSQEQIEKEQEILRRQRLQQEKEEVLALTSSTSFSFKFDANKSQEGRKIEKSHSSSSPSASNKNDKDEPLAKKLLNKFSFNTKPKNK